MDSLFKKSIDFELNKLFLFSMAAFAEIANTLSCRHSPIDQLVD